MHMAPSPRFSDTKAQAAIDDYLEGYKACQEALFYCQRKGGEYLNPDLLRELHDASQLCLTTANFLMRGSRHHRPLMRLGCDVLQACAEAIEHVEVDDDQLQVAYVACLQTRKSCLELIEPERGADQRKQDEVVEESFPASDPPGV